jgi:hypothetical protein
MPGVKAAMDEYAARGYIHHAERDTAIVIDNPPMSFVQLNYEKANFALPPYHHGWPVIWVKTQAVQNTQNTITQITAGIIVFDELTGKVFAGDSLADIAAQDPSFDVVQSTGGGGGGSPGDIIPKLVTQGAPDPLSGTPTETKFWKWMNCMSYFGSSCFVMAVTITFESGIWIVTWLAPPAFALNYAICMIFGGLTCLALQ